jgi:UDP-galactopyranose mutase
MFDAIVIGAGICGISAARVLAENGYNTLLLEKKLRVGGLCYDYKNQDSVYVHKYGPHLLNLNGLKSERTVKFLSEFCDFKTVRFVRTAYINKRYIQIPVCFDSIRTMYDKNCATAIIETLKACYPSRIVVMLDDLMNEERKYILRFANDIYTNIYLGYNMKMWNKRPEEMSPEVLARLPIYLNEYCEGDTKRYVVPTEGYSHMFANMLKHRNITLITNCRENITVRNDMLYFNGERFYGVVVYTAPIDELFNYEFGKLPYRSLRFKYERAKFHSDIKRSVVTFPNNYKKTRSSDMALLNGAQSGDYTVLVHEYPEEYHSGDRLPPAYPVLTPESKHLIEDYKTKAKNINNLILLGRLANFEYTDIGDSIASAINLTKILAKGER